MSKAVEATREIDAAKHRLERAKQAVDFVSKMSASANERMAAAQVQFDTALSQITSARSNLKSVQSQVSSCQNELAMAESNLKTVEERWEVIDIDSDGRNCRGQVSRVSVSPTVDLTSTSHDERLDSFQHGNADEISNSETIAGCVKVTDFQVEGSEILGVNGTYKIDGTYDGFPMYTKLGCLDGREEKFVLYHCTFRNGLKRWLVSTLKDKKEPGQFDYFYIESFHQTGFFPQQGIWSRKRENLGAHRLRVDPFSGLDKNGEEICFDKRSGCEGVEIYLAVEGSDVSGVNGIYEKSGEDNDIPVYSKAHFEIFRGKDPQRWFLRSRRTNIILYKSPIENPLSSKLTSIPCTNWEGTQSGGTATMPRLRVIPFFKNSDLPNHRKRSRHEGIRGDSSIFRFTDL